jgi:hypothetical protein
MDNNLKDKLVEVLNDVSNKQKEKEEKEKQLFIKFLNNLNYSELSKAIQEKGLPKITWYAKNLSDLHSIFNKFSTQYAQISPYLSDFNITLFWGKNGGVEFTYIDKYNITYGNNTWSYYKHLE